MAGQGSALPCALRQEVPAAAAPPIWEGDWQPASVASLGPCRLHILTQLLLPSLHVCMQAAATTLNPQLPATLAPTNPMAAGIRGQPQPAPAGPPSGASVASKVLGGVLMYVQGAKTCVDCQRSCIGTGGEARNYATCAIPTQVIPSCVCMLRALG